MPYKDPEKQKEYQRKWHRDHQRRIRARAKEFDELQKPLVDRLMAVIQELSEYQKMTPKEQANVKEQVVNVALEFHQRLDDLEKEIIRKVDEEMRQFSTRLQSAIEGLVTEKIMLEKVVDKRKLLAATILAGKKVES